MPFIQCYCNLIIYMKKNNALEDILLFPAALPCLFKHGLHHVTCCLAYPFKNQRSNKYF